MKAPVRPGMAIGHIAMSDTPRRRGFHNHTHKMVNALLAFTLSALVGHGAGDLADCKYSHKGTEADAVEVCVDKGRPAPKKTSSLHNVD